MRTAAQLTGRADMCAPAMPVSWIQDQEPEAGGCTVFTPMWSPLPPAAAAGPVIVVSYAWLKKAPRLSNAAFLVQAAWLVRERRLQQRAGCEPPSRLATEARPVCIFGTAATGCRFSRRES